VSTPAPTSPWIGAPQRKALVVNVADMVASNDSNAELVTYSLGSCLGITVYDPLAKVGGLLHVMLPDSSIDPPKAASSPFMFVDTGLPRLIAAVTSLGGSPPRFIIRVAGGSQFLDPGRIFNIGQRNQEALECLLARQGYTVQARDTGGVASRTLRFELATGRISIRIPGTSPSYL
jgi:chemotaxis protein CheD